MSNAAAERIGRAALLAALVIMLVGIALAASGARIGGDDFPDWWLVAILGVVAFAELFTTRFIVLPAQMKAASPGGESAEQPVQKVVASATLLIGAFSVAPAIYGMVGALFAGWWWLPIPFAAWGVLIYLVCHAYLGEAAADLSRHRIAEGVNG